MPQILEVVNELGCVWCIGNQGFKVEPCRFCGKHRRVEEKSYCPCCKELVE